MIFRNKKEDSDRKEPRSEMERWKMVSLSATDSDVGDSSAPQGTQQGDLFEGQLTSPASREEFMGEPESAKGGRLAEILRKAKQRRPEESPLQWESDMNEAPSGGAGFMPEGNQHQREIQVAPQSIESSQDPRQEQSQGRAPARRGLSSLEANVEISKNKARYENETMQSSSSQHQSSPTNHPSAKGAAESAGMAERRPAPIASPRVLATDAKLDVESDLKRRFGSNIKSALGAGTVIEGKFGFDSPVRIDGTLKGEISSPSVLIVGKQASVSGTIKVGSLIVLGTVDADIQAEDLVEIRSEGRILGDIKSSRLAIEDGGIFSGRNTPTKAS